MISYVEELQKIVETMSYTENVADFYGSIRELDNVSIEDLQLVAPEAIKQARSNPNSPLHSRETSPTRSIESIQNGYVNGYQNGYNQSATDTSDDEYIDTVEVKKLSDKVVGVLLSSFIRRTKFLLYLLSICPVSERESSTTPNRMAEFPTRR